MRVSSVRPALLAVALGAAAALGGCNAKNEAASSDDVKKSLDQLVQLNRDMLAATRENTGIAKTSGEDLKGLSGRIEALEKAVAASAASRKRGAIYLPLESETVCDDDASCTNTARAVCNKVNYPYATASRFTPGTRPLLNSAICFD